MEESDSQDWNTWAMESGVGTSAWKFAGFTFASDDDGGWHRQIVIRKPLFKIGRLRWMPRRCRGEWRDESSLFIAKHLFWRFWWRTNARPTEEQLVRIREESSQIVLDNIRSAVVDRANVCKHSDQEEH